MNVSRYSGTALVDDERGFGMVEIVVAMFIFMLVALSFLPFLIQSLKVSVLNTTTTTAAQIVNDQLDAALDMQRVSPSCDALTAFTATSLPSITDPRGVVLKPHRSTFTTCPAAYPATVKVTVWVETAAGENVGSSSVLIYLAREHT